MPDNRLLIEIARHVLGHAYPDKTFDELTDDEVERVSDNIGYADEVLADVMPVVAAAD